MSSSQRYLQRHQPGLAVTARNQYGSIQLFRKDENATPWGTLPLDARPGEREGVRFDATLEAFVGTDRLDASDIFEQGLENLLDEDRFQLRLVINHNDSGDPFDIPVWSTGCVEVVPRPTLPESQGAALWTLAERLPCEEQRYFVCDEKGCWQVERVVAEKPTVVEEPPEEPIADRFVMAARSFPTRPSAKPFAIPGSAKGTRGEGLGAFQIR